MNSTTIAATKSKTTFHAFHYHASKAVMIMERVLNSDSAIHKQTEKAKNPKREKINSLHLILCMQAINLFCRASRGFSFASHAAELWYVFHVRVSYGDYMLRFVGAPDDVMCCVSCFYSYKSKS